MKSSKSSTLPPNITPKAMLCINQRMHHSRTCYLLLATAHHRQASKLPFHICICGALLSFPSSQQLCPSSKVPYSINDSGSLRLQSSFAKIPRCFAYPWKTVSTFLPSQHIVPPPHLRSASRGRSSTAEPVQAAAECRLLRLLKTLSDGCSVFPSP